MVPYFFLILFRASSLKVKGRLIIKMEALDAFEASHPLVTILKLLYTMLNIDENIQGILSLNIP